MLDRLPYDIFRQIIRDVHIFQGNHFWGDHLKVPLPPTIASHVCRSWRDALLSDPTMWTCLSIPQMNPDELSETLSRSCQAPLSVFININRYIPVEAEHLGVLSRLLQELDRFEIFEITIDPMADQPAEDLYCQILSCIRGPAPILHSFYLRIKNGDVFQGEDLMDTLFSGDAPNLRHVFQRISFGFHELLHTPLFRNLLGLHLELGTHARLHFDILFDVLELSPCLEKLQIITQRISEDTLPDISLPILGDRRIYLPYLTELILRIDNILDTVNIVWKHLVFPQTAHCRIISYDLYRETVNSIFSLPFSCQIRPDFSVVDFRVSHVQMGFTEGRQGSMRPISFQAYFSNVNKLVDVFSDLMHSFNLSSVTQFSIHFIAVPLESTVLREIFASMMNLDSLTITHHCWDDALVDPPAPTSVLTALIPVPLQMRDYIGDASEPLEGSWSANREFPCPSLRTVKISIPREDVRLDAPYAAMLCLCSDVRGVVGHPIGEITISCHAGVLTEEAAAILWSRGNSLIKLSIIKYQSDYCPDT